MTPPKNPEARAIYNDLMRTRRQVIRCLALAAYGTDAAWLTRLLNRAVRDYTRRQREAS